MESIKKIIWIDSHPSCMRVPLSCKELIVGTASVTVDRLTFAAE